MVADHLSCKPVCGRKNFSSGSSFAQLASDFGSQFFQKREDESSSSNSRDISSELLGASKCEECNELFAEVWCKNCYVSVCTACDSRIHSLKAHHVRIPFGSRNLVKQPRSPQSVLGGGAAFDSPPPHGSRVGSPRVLSITGYIPVGGSHPKLHESDLFWNREGPLKGAAAVRGGRGASLGSRLTCQSLAPAEDEDGDIEEDSGVGSFTEEDIFFQGIEKQRERGSPAQQAVADADGTRRKDEKKSNFLVGIEQEEHSTGLPTEGKGADSAGDRDAEVSIADKKAQSDVLTVPQGRVARPENFPVSASSLAKADLADPETTVLASPPPSFQPSELEVMPSKPEASTGPAVTLPGEGTMEAPSVEACAAKSTQRGARGCSISIPVGGLAKIKGRAEAEDSSSAEESPSSCASTPTSPYLLLRRSASCPSGQQSALRGSRLRPVDLRVQWAPDVRDPPPSSASHTLGGTGSLARRSRRPSGGSPRGRRKAEAKKGGEGGKGKKAGKGGSHGRKGGGNGGGSSGSSPKEMTNEMLTAGKFDIIVEGCAGGSLDIAGSRGKGHELEGKENLEATKKSGGAGGSPSRAPADAGHCHASYEPPEVDSSCRNEESRGGGWSKVERKGSRRADAKGKAAQREDNFAGANGSSMGKCEPRSSTSLPSPGYVGAEYMHMPGVGSHGHGGSPLQHGHGWSNASTGMASCCQSA